MYILGIDVGTTAVKSILFDLKGNIIASAIDEYNLFIPRQGFVEIDADQYWTSCKNCIKYILNKSNIDVEDISSLAIASQGETFIVLDKNGIPLRKAIVWYDNRSEEECKILRSKFSDEETFKITGQPKIIPTWPATKILWIRRHEPNVFKRINKIIMVEDYLIHILTGEFATGPP